MRFAPVIDALALPVNARVDQRVPKKLLLEQGAPTTADKRQIQEGIDELFWIAALKPSGVGIPAFRDEVREYLEIAVLTVGLRPAAKTARLVELIHRAIPYPLVLVTGHGETVSLSLAHLRGSQGETGKVVIEDLRRTAPFRPDAPTSEEAAFLDSLALSGLPRGDLWALYQGWLDRVVALEAARITGQFILPEGAERSQVLREELGHHARLQRELAALRVQAVKEKQMGRRVELNLEIKQLESELALIMRGLGYKGS